MADGRTIPGLCAICHFSFAMPDLDPIDDGPAWSDPPTPRRARPCLAWPCAFPGGRAFWRAGLGCSSAGAVNALPPLKVVQLLGNACLSPTTLAPKGPFRPRGPKWILLFSLDSVEPHRVTSNDLVGALGAIPAAWWRTSHDVLARLMFSSRADSFSPANRLHPHYQRANSIVPGAGSRSRIVYNNHHSFTYAASVA